MIFVAVFNLKRNGECTISDKYPCRRSNMRTISEYLADLLQFSITNARMQKRTTLSKVAIINVFSYK